MEHAHAEEKPIVAVAGASGFIGQALGPVLAQRFRPIGLSRSSRKPRNGYLASRQVDLFSLKNATEALEGADYAVYLVHSMMPSARLVQGDFGDLDVLCADNFGRAAAQAGVRRILYVGGLIPSDTTLSAHLESRLEVERALGTAGVPVTTLRAGMVVGPNGSSYQLLARLVRRLPLMACPSWTQTRMQPVALDEVVASIDELLDEPGNDDKTYDLGTDEAVTYLGLMEAVAESLSLRRRFIPLPLLSPKLSRLWVCLTTGAPRALVGPLIESLEHDMVVRPEAHFRPHKEARRSITTMLAEAGRAAADRAEAPRAFRRLARPTREASKVCSVQRLQLPSGVDSNWLTNSYFSWLQGFMRGLIRIEVDDGAKHIRFVIGPTGHKLLGLERIESRSTRSRQVLRVTSGLLARKTERGRLEFRLVLGGRVAIAALHEFVPRLPWWLYRTTQGTFHRWVMHRFCAFVAEQPDQTVHDSSPAREGALAASGPRPTAQPLRLPTA